jgi:ubiquinone/menaquinone biosynthesis C-methylase UbiE
MIDRLQQEYKNLACIYDQRWKFYTNATISKTMEHIRNLPISLPVNNYGNYALQELKILEIGCGTGELTAQLLKHFPNAAIFGIDVSSDMLNLAQQKLADYQPRLRLIKQNVTDLNFPKDTFDLIISSSVWHYLTDPKTVLEHIYRVLKPKGYLLINDWCGDYLTCALLDQYLHLTKRPHYHTYTQRELQQLIIDHHFLVRDLITYKINWFWGMMLVISVKPEAVTPETLPLHPENTVYSAKLLPE